MKETVKIKNTDVKKTGFDEFYAEAWSKMQGAFSSKIANNLVGYLKKNKINAKSVLDICSGSGEFLSIMKNSIPKCVGVDSEESYLNFVKRNYSDIEFYKVDNFHSFKIKGKFDIITCNHDVVNMFNGMNEWNLFLANCAKMLNKNGVLLFDYYTKSYFDKLVGTTYEESDEVDYVSKISKFDNKTIFNEVYYIKESSLHYRKTSDIMVEQTFDNKLVFSAVTNAGFTYTPIDISFNTLKDLDSAKRIHLLCRKK